ncbi:MAG: GTPase [Planctomycetota bacterium]
MTRVTLTTANTPGAVAILHLHGEGIEQILEQFTGRSGWSDRHAYLVHFADIDEGLAIRFDNATAQLMPHGGLRVVHRLIEHLIKRLGCNYDNAPNPVVLFPEAQSLIEADMLDAIAKAASPAAIDLLAAQPTLWRGLLQQAGGPDQAQRQAIAGRSRILDRLITPPTVVVAGPANVGKSTLTNALMGKNVSIVADLPGTTRDWVGGLVELNGTHDPRQAIAVNWLDTPGLRRSNDPIEQRAIALAKHQIEHADILIAMRDPDRPWPDRETLPRDPDLFVLNKADDALRPEVSDGRSEDRPLAISAEHHRNLDFLQAVIIQRLGLDRLGNKPWAFTKKLLAWCESGEQPSLSDYLNPISTA